MNSKVRIEIDAQTAELLNVRAMARGMSVSDLIADLAGSEAEFSAELEAMRQAGEGPWSKEFLAEDERRLAEFQLSRAAVPWDEVKSWMQSWGTPDELPMPKSLKTSRQCRSA